MDEKKIKIFEENIERFSFFSKEDAELIRRVIPKSVSFSRNKNGELNLQIDKGDHVDYVYSTENASLESSNWFSGLKCENIKILYLFGIGLGYYYNACKDWLSKDATRILIFLEDDLEIIYHFFQTELAKEILHNSQVRLQYLDKYDSANEQGFDALTTAFMFDPYRFSSLDYYQTTRSKLIVDLTQFFSHSIYSKQMKYGEFLTGSVGYFTNYYNNLKFLPESYLGNSMFGKFENVPAIICGAGPSLEKNIHLLKSLGDRALIIAGGSAINALNSYDFFPHFTAGIDPNPSQLMRILSNNGYETPFFYRNRIFTEALEINSGSKLYITGSGGYDLHKWIEKKLGITKEDPIDEGYNIVNFSVSIAKNLGCNPIILCGMDLAYTNNQSYISGMKFHPLHNFKKSFLTKSETDEVICFKDINGNATKTLWKWINEASWYPLFAEQNKATLIINATEGGIGFPDIQQMTLAEVANKYLFKMYDFENMIHGEIQNSSFPKDISHADIIKILKLLRKALGDCELCLKSLMEEYAFAIREKRMDYETSISSSLEKIDALKEIFLKNDYYIYVLKRFSEIHHYVYEKRINYFLYDLEKDSKDAFDVSALELELDNYKFLKAIIKVNKGILEKAIKDYKKKSENCKEKRKKRVLKSTFKKDTALGGEKRIELYPNQATKSEQHVSNGLLNGLSTFYSETGNVLASSWYEKGLKEGVNTNYYLTGELFSIRNFKHGLQDGPQEFYFKDGKIKSIINYTNGVLDGKVLLYYSNHILKRELHFKLGLRDGPERMWSDKGVLIIEAEYLNDKPCGIANWWYDNGVLKQTVTHSEKFENYQIQCFAPDGKEISKEIVEDKDYFDKLIEVTNTFMVAIEGLFKNADILLPLLEGDEAEEVKSRKEQFELIRVEVDKLIDLNKTIKENFSGNAHQFEEPFWKSKALQEKIDDQLNGLIEAMKTEIEAVQNLIIKAMKNIADKQNE